MGGRLDHTPSQLSGGEQQRTTIARAVANRPDILLLDEPTGDLDSKNSDIIMRMLLDLNQQEDITCIMVTHDTSMKLFAHRCVHMLDGKIHRIEAIDGVARAESSVALTQRVAEHEASRSVTGSLSAAPPSVHLAGGAAPPPLSETRDPGAYYPFHRFAVAAAANAAR